MPAGVGSSPGGAPHDRGGFGPFSQISRASTARSPKRLKATLRRARKARMPSTPGSAYRRTEKARQEGSWRRRRWMVVLGGRPRAAWAGLRGISGRGRRNAFLVSSGPGVVPCDTGPSRLWGNGSPHGLGSVRAAARLCAGGSSAAYLCSDSTTISVRLSDFTAPILPLAIAS